MKTRSRTEKRCVVCGVPFLAARSDALTCSGACRILKFKGQAPRSGPRVRTPRGWMYQPFTFCG